MQMSHAIRAAARHGASAHQPRDARAELEPAPRDVDFGAGVRGMVQPAPDMNEAIRASYFSAWVRSSIGGR